MTMTRLPDFMTDNEGEVQSDREDGAVLKCGHSRGTRNWEEEEREAIIIIDHS